MFMQTIRYKNIENRIQSYVIFLKCSKTDKKEIENWQ